jgi:ATP-dependent Zn protease
MRTFIELLVSWAPMLLLIGVWVYFMRRSGSQGQYFEHVRIYMVEHVAETKRLNANLERIAAILEAKTSGGKE